MDYNKVFDQIKDKLPSIEINDFSDLTAKDFKAKYGYPEVPVLLKSRFKNLYESIDFDELEKTFHSKDWEFESTEEKEASKMSFKSYFESGSTAYYLRLNMKSIDFKIHAPQIFECWYKSYPTEKEKKELTWLYYGNKNTFTNIHTDVWKFNSWLLLLKGKKLWFIYPKAYNSIIKKEKEKFGIENIENLLNSNIKPLMVVQNPGEMMYVPSDTFHFVINLETSLAYTGNFMNETNYENVKQFFAKSDNKNNKKFINNIIATGMTNFKIRNL
ncbi:JmjC domain-containing protein [Chryseobacterium sp. VD8]|uniref:JmjC domain-containing protein n=1 Tax=Chryseobacterium sp. VD8 TaxID=3081254 RepID=UPI0030175054